MTKGILLFALQSTFDYIALAVKSAQQIKRITDMPISVVTDQEIDNSNGLFDKIIVISEDAVQKKVFYNGVESSEFHVWKNFSRCLSYDLSPYHHTLVIDTDYIVNSNFLISCFDIDKDFLIYKDSVDLADWRNDYEFKYVNQFSVPFYWATVFMFKKNEKTKHFFDLLKEIKNNWHYFRLIYQIKESTFRNDYAFSIAIHIFYNSIPDNFVDVFPGKLFYTLDKDHFIKFRDNKMVFNLQKDDTSSYVPLLVQNLDVHIMNKYDLLKVLP